MLDTDAVNDGALLEEPAVTGTDRTCRPLLWVFVHSVWLCVVWVPSVAPDIPPTSGLVMFVAAHWFIATSTTSPEATSIPPAPVAEKLVPADPSTPVVVCVRSRVSPVDEYHVEITASDAVPDGSDTLTVDDATADARTYRPRRIDPVDVPAAVVPDVVSAIFVHPDPDRSGSATE
ncbi:MAG TPA: hypothetical protein PLB92_00090 [Rhodoglobus sp.]|nr:hypothetical protein [Rhodoglobus sp.]